MGQALQVVHQSRGASRIENPRRSHFVSDIERANRLCVLASDLSLGTNRFCTRNGRTSGVDQHPPFIMLARHDGGFANGNTTTCGLIGL